MIDDRADRAFTALRDANPVPADQVAGWRASSEADAILERVLSHGRRPRRRVVIAVAAALAILLALVALIAAVLIRDERPAEPAELVCFSEATLDPMYRAGTSANGDPVDLCLREWRNGAVGPGPIPSSFAVCVFNDIVAVIPGEAGTTCDRLGLPRASIGPVERKMAAFQEELMLAIGERCLGLEDTIRVSKAMLDKYGYEDWTVRMTPGMYFDELRRCGSLAVLIPERELRIVPIPDMRTFEGGEIPAQTPPST
jgi:hypothetical protein